MAKFHSLSVDNTLKATERKSLFLAVPADSSKRIRFFPPVTKDGALFVLNVNHFNLQEDDKGTAYACLNAHGEGKCPLCAVSKYMMDSGDKALDKVGKQIKASNNWYAQVLDGRKVDGKLEYFGPYLMRFSKTGADAINAIIRAQATADEPFFTDPVKGKDVIFSRTGAGFDTKYTAMVAGDPNPLDKAFPGWQDAAFDSLEDKLEIKLKTPEQMVAAAAAAHSLDWESVLKGAGVL